MIADDLQLAAARARVGALEDILVSLRRTETPANYALMSKAYLLDIERTQREIIEYFTRLPEPVGIGSG